MNGIRYAPGAITGVRWWLHPLFDDSDGVLNLEWHAATRVLVVRSVIRSKARREIIIARFLSFLFTSFASRIKAIHVLRV